MLNGEAFIKRTKSDPAKTYPDFGCTFETFTNNEFLEIETLGPFGKVAPGQTVQQSEQWGLFRNVKLSEISDDAIDHAILPLLKTLGSGN